MRLYQCTVLSSILSLASYAPAAIAGDDLKAAFMEGTPYLDMRYRYEYVNQDGLPEDANASTLRTRLGYASGDFHGFSGTLEFENITQIGNDNYNDTLNGRTNRPVVADIESTEVNQAFLQFTGIEDTRLRIGRERINLDNQRFIGAVGWRQNDQTFDVFSFVNQSIEDTKITYAYLDEIHRIFGEDSSMGNFESNSHIINVSNTSLPLGTIAAYGYLLDFENDAPALSSRTYGVSLNGKQQISDDGLWFKYHAEYARQSDYGDNTTNYDADYYHLAPALSYQGLTGTVGYEVLGSDNSVASFNTPLATLHKFNGFADVFLTTPAAGLEDFYIDVTYKFSDMQGDLAMLNGLLLKGQYHDFSAEDGGADYGTEFDFYAKMPIKDHYYVEAKYADYDADSFATDRQKFTMGVGLKF